MAADGLQVTVINQEGRGRVFDSAEMPVPEPMRRSLARVFAEQSLRWHSQPEPPSWMVIAVTCCVR